MCTVLSQFINQRTPVLLKDNKILLQTVICMWQKFVENILSVLYGANKIWYQTKVSSWRDNAAKI